MPALSWRTGGVVALLALGAMLWLLAPRVEVEAGRQVLLGGAQLPAAPGGTDPDAVTWFAAGTEITNAGMLPIRISNARAVAVDDEVRVTIRVRPPRTPAAPPAAGSDDGAVVAKGGTAELWVTIGQPGCAPGGLTRIERGLRGIVVDVTQLGLTWAVTLDVDLAAYVESGAGPLPPCD